MDPSQKVHIPDEPLLSSTMQRQALCADWWRRQLVRPWEQKENEMALESFAISFAKLVLVQEHVDINKDIDVSVYVQGNSALANSKAEADALGPNSHSETLSLTTTTAVQGVGSSSSSIAESVSAATKAYDFHW
jgi:hypothetical protein